MRLNQGWSHFSGSEELCSEMLCFIKQLGGITVDADIGMLNRRSGTQGQVWVGNIALNYQDMGSN